MQAGLWAAAAGSLAVGLIAGWRDWRRVRRHDPDAVGPIDWGLVQVLAVLAAVVCTALALRAGG
ncbi:hypothetical protein [Sphingomonas sp.]|uniref:hypothetical protein n=1 Tax=Sphingomonas sp. TaxID=28214 RepID=UPI001D7DD280|nr:hypothetical protein [Sphingomonas sp.]MBX9796542.1 hypothetical protein [Sphingomonas sp.]